MDPIVCLNELRELAKGLLDDADQVRDDQPWHPDPADVYSLCERVQDLDEWMVRGGFSPWATGDPFLIMIEAQRRGR